MTAVKTQARGLNACKMTLQCALAMLMSAVCGIALAQQNAVESITAKQQGANIIVKVDLKNPVAKPPIGFSITNPARIALDFSSTNNDTGKSVKDIGLGDLRNINVVQAGERTRLVFNLNRPLNYATAIEGNAVIVTINGSGGVATALNAVGVPVTGPVPCYSERRIRRERGLFRRRITRRRLINCARKAGIIGNRTKPKWYRDWSVYWDCFYDGFDLLLFTQ